MLNNLKSSRIDIIISLLLIVIVAVTRIPFVSKFLYEWDSASYALAFQNFNLAQEQPQTPGYILFVALGKASNYIFHDPNTSMVFLSIFFSILTAILVYFFVKRIFSTRTAIASSILLIFNPLFWFYGEIASIYIFEAFFAALIAYLSYKVLKGDGERFIYLSALILGLAGGFRLDLVEFMFPVWLFSLWYGYRKNSFIKIIKALIVLIIGVLLWFIPTIISAGGLEQYLKLASSLSTTAGYTSVLLGANFSSQVINSGLALVWSLWGLTIFGIVMILLFLVYHNNSWRSKFVPYLKNPLSIFFILWIAPAFLFYLIIYVIKPGYILVYLPALMIILGYVVNRLSYDLTINFPRISPRSFLVSLLLIGIIVNSVIYFYPYNLHQAETWETSQDQLHGSQKLFFETDVGIMYNNQKIKANDQNTNLHINTITKLSNSNPNNTIIVIRDITREDEGFNFRKAMYYLPDYSVYYLYQGSGDSRISNNTVWHGQYDSFNVNSGPVVTIPLNKSVQRIVWIMSNETDFYQQVQSQSGVQTINLPNGLNIYYSNIGNGPVNLEIDGFTFTR